MARSEKVSKQPSPYPGIPFHFLRFLQFGGSFGTLVITVYFSWNLTHDRYGVPWVFLILLITSMLTIIAILTTTLMHCCRSLNVVLNLVFNLVLSVLWIAGFGLLAWATNETINAQCNNENWGNIMGTLICRAFKGLYSMSLIALISSVLCLILDLVVRREQNSRGRYVQAPDIKLDEYNTAYAGRRDSGGPFEVPRGYGGQHERGTSVSSDYQQGFGNDRGNGYDDQESGVTPVSSRYEGGYGHDHHVR